MNHIFVQLYVATMNYVDDVARSRTGIGRSGQRRGAGMLEYVLLGAIAAVIIGVIMREQLGNIVQNLVKRIQSVVKDSARR